MWCDCDVMWLWCDVIVMWCVTEVMWCDVIVMWCDCDVMCDRGDVMWCDCDVMCDRGDVMWCDCDVMCDRGDVMWCDVMWCDVWQRWCDVMWCDVMWCDVMWCVTEVMWCDVMWCDVMWCVTEVSGEYCERDMFHAECVSSDELVLITAALYGRMRQGKCVSTTPVGCYVNVHRLLAAKCSARQRCHVSVASLVPDRSQPCHADYRSYLEASYTCIKGNSFTLPSHTLYWWRDIVWN